MRWANTHAGKAADVAAMQVARSHAGLLASELQKYRLLPLVLTEYPDVGTVLDRDDDASTARLNQKLELIADRTGSAVIYVIRRNGRTIAASNWRHATSFVGQNYTYRPYFHEALRDGAAELFALGTISGRPGLFIAQRVVRDGRVLGVVVVKVEFDAMEAVWARQPGPTIVTDRNNVVIVTSRPDWRFRSLYKLDPPAIARLRETLLYGGMSLAPLGIRFNGEGQPNGMGANSYRSVMLPAGLESGELRYLQPLAPALASARASAYATLLGALVVALLVLGYLLRTRERASLQADARANLERQVTLRTVELTEANRMLRQKSLEREQADALLRSARDELAQANRLGYIGQITASVAHEINQPLAAIRTFAENALQFLNRDKPGNVRSNLDIIVDLTARIAGITAELRSFSRRGARDAERVEINAVVNGALLMIGDRLRSAGIAFVRSGEQQKIEVMANRIGLEQVLINLLQNAAEALDGRADPRIAIAVRRERTSVIVEVSDNGPGVPADLQDEVFTPFVTGRPEGLGLGLGIARDIAREFNGDLLLHASSPEGAAFRLKLECA